MRLSDKKIEEVVAAIIDPIMTLRISLLQKKVSLDEMDGKLFRLEIEIWEKVAKALGRTP